MLDRTQPVPRALVAALAALVVPGDRATATRLAGAR